MAFNIRQHNFGKAPTAEQRKVFLEAWSMTPTSIPATRIEAHLTIAELAKQPEKSAQLKAWREQRTAARKVRREAHAPSR